MDGNIARIGGSVFCESFPGNTLVVIRFSGFSGNFALQGGIMYFAFLKKGVGRIVIEETRI